MAAPEDLPPGVVRPFRGRLVRQERAQQRVFPMLDALPASERTSDPRPLRGAPRTIDPDDYGAAADALYLYRLARGEDEHVGVVAEVSAAAFLDGQVRGHEAVQPDRVAALVEHFTASSVRSELVALLHRPGPALAATVEATRDATPLVRFTGPDGWEQTVWRVPDDLGATLAEELGEAVHYIADGHHRVAASLEVWNEAGKPDDSGLMCVIYPLDGLNLLAFHRRVVGPVDVSRVLDLLAGSFEVVESHDEVVGGNFALYAEGRWYAVTYTGDREPGAAGLDIAIIDGLVLQPLLGADAPSSRVETATALTPVDELTSACDRDGGVLFALRPPSLGQLTEVADRGEVMPPKTTYFDPKPFAGIFLR